MACWFATIEPYGAVQSRLRSTRGGLCGVLVDGNQSNHTKRLNGSLWSTGIGSRDMSVCGNQTVQSGPGPTSFDARWFVQLVGGWESIEQYVSVERKPSVDGNWFARRVGIIRIAMDQSSSSSS